MALKAAKNSKRKPSRRASTEKPVAKCGLTPTRRPLLETPVVSFDERAFAICAGKIRFAVENQIPSLAEAALKQFLQENGVRGSLTMESPISWLQTESRPEEKEGLDLKELNSLETAGFLTVGAFLSAHIRDLRSIHQFGVGTIERIERIRASVRRELAGLSPKRVSQREAVEKALRGDLN